MLGPFHQPKSNLVISAVTKVNSVQAITGYSEFCSKIPHNDVNNSKSYMSIHMHQCSWETSMLN